MAADPHKPPAQSRPLASYETGFWAFLGYRSVVVAVLIWTAIMLAATIALVVK